MEVKRIKLKSLKNINELVDNSYNGTSFSYDFFLKLKNVEYVLCVYDEDKLVSFMPLFEDNGDLNQSTMYIPYGGPVILYNFPSYRKNIIYTRNILNVICLYLKNNYKNVCLSLDPLLTDIISFVKNGFIPEVRYTYKIDLNDNLDMIYSNFGRDRKKQIKLCKNYKVIFDDKCSLFDLEKALIWEYNYSNDISVDFTKKYLSEAIKNNNGKIFLASDGEKILGGVAIVWDNKNAYIMYSYYDKTTTTVIPFLYYEIIKYLKDHNICENLDFEGSVFKEIEEWNLSFGSKQFLYFNFYYGENREELFNDLYDYGEKNDKYV